MALTYITNGKIVLPGEVVCGKALVFDSQSGKIVGIADELPADADVIDAAGNYVAPGLIDIHIHGYLGEDTGDGEPFEGEYLPYADGQHFEVVYGL